MFEMNIEATLIEEMLGTASANPELYEEFIASKRPEGVDSDEVETLPTDEEVKKQTTVFHRESNRPFIYDYLIKGFFKNACSALRRVKGTKSAGLTAYKKIIDGLIFITPRKILILGPDGDSNGEAPEIGICERPIRIQGPKGERVALARSETVPAGCVLQFTIETYDPGLRPNIIEWLDYGKRNALGQWHNSGKGRIDYVITGESGGEKKK